MPGAGVPAEVEDQGQHRHSRVATEAAVARVTVRRAVVAEVEVASEEGAVVTAVVVGVVAAELLRAGSKAVMAGPRPLRHPLALLRSMQLSSPTAVDRQL